MRTYQDLQACSTDEEKINFIKMAIAEHESSEKFVIGQDAGYFYRHVDRELEYIRQMVYDRDGNAYNSEKSNHKLVSNMFFIFCTQLIAYQLGNGVSFDNPKVKEALGGSDFDFELQKVLAYAFCDGESYGFVGENGITPLCYACKLDNNEPFLVPLYDEDNGDLKAAVRYWRLDTDKPLRVTLYEQDGFTEYKEDKNGSLAVLESKKSYGKNRTISSKAEGIIKQENETSNPAFPIVKMPYINNQSELVGNKSTLFAYDVVYSGLVNGVDMNTVYWIIKNADGMSKKEDLQFVADIIRNNVIHEVEDVEIRKEEISFNHAAFENVLAVLRDKLYTDFMAVDVQRQVTGNVTTVEIKAAYQNLNLKCDMIEKYLSDFIRGCLKVKGFDENEPFHFKRPNDINVTEYATMLVQIAPFLGEESTLKLLCETLGIIDEYEEIKEKREAEAMSQVDMGDMGNAQTSGNVPENQGETENSEVADSKEAIETAEEVTGKALNGIQVQSLINIIGQLSEGKISENQAVKIISTAIGVSESKAREIIRGE